MPTDTVGSLRSALLQLQPDWPADRLKLVCDGRVLCNLDESLSTIGLDRGARLVAVVPSEQHAKAADAAVRSPTGACTILPTTAQSKASSLPSSSGRGDSATAGGAAGGGRGDRLAAMRRIAGALRREARASQIVQSILSDPQQLSKLGAHARGAGLALASATNRHRGAPGRAEAAFGADPLGRGNAGGDEGEEGDGSHDRRRPRALARTDAGSARGPRWAGGKQRGIGGGAATGGPWVTPKCCASSIPRVRPG